MARPRPARTCSGSRACSSKLFRAPAIFGAAEAMYGVRYQENVETISASRIAEMPVGALRAFLLAAPASGVAFVDDLAAHLATGASSPATLPSCATRPSSP